MAIEIKMPQLGLTMTEGTVAAWHKKIGDEIKKGEPIADIETDKITTELESEAEGTLLAIIADVGAEVPVQGLLCVIGAPGEKVEAVAAPAAAAAKSDPVVASAPVAAVSAVAAAPAPSAGIAAKTESGRIRISPLAKKIAGEHRVDYGNIPGTGAGGRITRKDILAAIQAAASSPQGASAAAAGAPVAATGGRRERMTSMRKVVSERMFKSHSEIPVVTQTMKIDVTDLLAFRQKINAKRETRFSINDLVLKAVAKALSVHRNVLVSIDGTDIIHHDEVNLGMAVALDGGLIVPVIRNADKMSLEAVAAAARDLAERARDNRLEAHEYQGSTFSVSNLGMFGVESFTPIINQPDAAILGICSIEDELALADGQPVVRKIMRISMTYDHRLLDGAAAAKFQQAVKGLLEEPMDIVL